MSSRKYRRAIGALLSGALLVTAPAALAFETQVDAEDEVRKEQLQEPAELKYQVPQEVREKAFEGQEIDQKMDEQQKTNAQ